MNRIFKKIREMWGLDLRSLALFRMAAAICLMGDFKMRASDLVAHYTDFGVLPRRVLLEFFAGQWSVSLHLASGLWQVQAVLFGVSIVLALMLLVGYQTRLAAFFSWLLLVSVQMRNPMLLQGGDVLFRMILFWSLFLPLGACYSVDRAMSLAPPPKSKTVFSVATIAFILQIAFLYWFTAFLKMSGGSKAVWWDQGTAVFNALSIDQFAKPLGQYLLGFPQLLKVFNYATILNEMFGPILFFMPFGTAFFKLIGVAAFILMHISFGLCMLIGPFSWIGSIAVLPMLPGAFWDKLEASTLKHKFLTALSFPRRRESMDPPVKPEDDNELNPSTRAIDSKIGAFVYDKINRNRDLFAGLTSRRHSRPVKTRLSFIGNMMAAAALAFVFCWNFGSVNPKFAVPVKWQGWGLVLALDQHWNMFSPPLLDDGWYVIPGKLRDGTEVDLFKNGAPVDFSKPQYVYKTYKNTRWRKYLMNIWMASNEKHRLYYGQYLCRDWNTKHSHDKLLDTFDIDFMQEKTQPLMTPVVHKVLVWRHYCFKVPDPTPAIPPKT